MKKMIIKGHKDIKSIGIIWLAAGIFFVILTIILTVRDGSFNSQPLFCGIASFIIALVAAWENSTVYIVDEKSITRKTLFREQSFKWEEFKFIGDFYQNGIIKGTDHWMICSTHPKPLTDKGTDDRNYRWSRRDSILIRWRGEEFYREFLSCCGGERDERD